MGVDRTSTRRATVGCRTTVQSVGRLAHGWTLVVVLVMLGAVTSGTLASPLRRLAASTVAFASDGTRFVAWQAQGDEQIVVLDSFTGQQRPITPPVGCLLHDDAEDGEPIASAAAGRFLLECGGGVAQALLDVQTGASVPLPKKANGTSDWYRVGTRYVIGVNVLYDIATGASTPLHKTADLDAPDASTNVVCPAVRRLLIHNPWQGLWRAYAFQGHLFAQDSGKRGNVQIDRCHGRPTILRASGGETFGNGKPQDFDLRGGLLSWDTGSAATGYIPSELQFRGSLYAYELGSHRHHRWPLPRLPVTVAGETVKGTYGYSTHTANTVFWIATQTLGGEKVPSVETSSVYAAPLK
jgi:hypothetical protein